MAKYYAYRAFGSRHFLTGISFYVIRVCDGKCIYTFLLFVLCDVWCVFVCTSSYFWKNVYIYFFVFDLFCDTWSVLVYGQRPGNDMSCFSRRAIGFNKKPKWSSYRYYIIQCVRSCRKHKNRSCITSKNHKNISFIKCSGGAFWGGREAVLRKWIPVFYETLEMVARYHINHIKTDHVSHIYV